MLDEMLKKIGKIYKLTEKPAGEYGRALVNGMDFFIRGYDAEGLGAVSIMTGEAGGGMMKMETLVVNPFDVDAALFSYDRIQMPGKDMAYLECYDTRIDTSYGYAGLKAVEEAYSALQDIPSPGECWYDSITIPGDIKKVGTSEQTEIFDRMTMEYFDEYMKCLGEAKACDRAEKIKKAQTYTEGLLNNGGTSTTPFLNAKGKEFTQRMFRDLFFGTGDPE